MTWKPAEYLDAEFRKWMKAMGWEVTRTEYGARSQLYGWRHEAFGRLAYTLRISRKVLEDYPAFAVLVSLGALEVAAAMRAHPDARYVVVQNGLSVALRDVPE